MDLDEAIKQASAWYVRNTMPTYSKVPKLIQNLKLHRLETSYPFQQKH